MTDGTYRHPRDIESLLRSLVPVVCPSDVTDLGLTDFIIEHSEMTMASQTPAIRNAFLLGMRSYDAAATLRFLRPARALSADKHRRYFKLWWHGPSPLFRTFATSVKGMLCIAYYVSPVVLDRMGYTADEWVDKVKTRRLAVYKDEIDAHERALLAPDPLPRGHFSKKVEKEVRHAV